MIVALLALALVALGIHAFKCLCCVVSGFACVCVCVYDDRYNCTEVDPFTCDVHETCVGDTTAAVDYCCWRIRRRGDVAIVVETRTLLFLKRQ